VLIILITTMITQNQQCVFDNNHDNNNYCLSPLISVMFTLDPIRFYETGHDDVVSPLTVNFQTHHGPFIISPSFPPSFRPSHCSHIIGFLLSISYYPHSKEIHNNVLVTCDHSISPSCGTQQQQQHICLIIGTEC